MSEVSNPKTPWREHSRFRGKPRGSVEAPPTHYQGLTLKDKAAEDAAKFDALCTVMRQAALRHRARRSGR